MSDKRKKEVFTPEVPDGTPIVEISDAKLEELEHLGRLRQEYSGNMFSATERDLNPKKHQMGVIGEWAFAEHYGLKHDIRTSKPDRGWDFRVRDRKTGNIGTIDVKVTKHQNGALLIPKDKSLDADAYYLLLKHGRYVCILGYCLVDTAAKAPVLKEELNLPIRTRVIYRTMLREPMERDRIVDYDG